MRMGVLFLGRHDDDEGEEEDDNAMEGSKVNCN